MDLLKEAIGPPAHLTIGPVLAFDDAVGLKVRALHDRAAHRDFIDVHAAYARYGWHDLEMLAARHTAGFALEELADRLGAVDELETATFAAYGLADADVSALAQWARAWESNIRERLASGESGPTGPSETEWDSYLDRD